MDRRVTTATASTPRPDPRPPPLRARSMWTGVLLVAAGIAFGYLLAQDTPRELPPVDTRLAEVVTSAPVEPVPIATSEPPVGDAVRSEGSILASVDSGRGLVMWPERGDPINIQLASEMRAAAYDAARGRIAVTLREDAGDGLALYVGDRGDVRFVTSRVTGFAWHPTDANAIAWVQESEDGFVLVKGSVSDGLVMATEIAVLRSRIQPVAWGSWGFAVQSDTGLTTIAPSGAILAHDYVQFVAAGSDGRLVVARPAGVPSSSDLAMTGPDLADQRILERSPDLDAHPAAAAILPGSGRIVLVSNRFGDDTDVAHIEILDADGVRRALIRSGMIAESIAWSPDEARLAIGGYYYDGPDRVRSVVLLVASDGTGEPIEVPFAPQLYPLGVAR